MGVIHKLKPEIVNFIVQNKTDDAFLSCRQLAEIVYEAFEVKVSKSSVNKVIKDAQLSSSIGRRPVNKLKQKRFSIPREKKEQLFGSIQSPDISRKETEPGKAETISQNTPRTHESKAEDNLKQQIDEFLSKEYQEKEVIKPSAEFVQDNFQNELEKIRLKRKKAQSRIRSHAGLNFLFAAKKEIEKTSFIAEVLASHTKSDLPEYFEQMCELILFLSVLGIDPLEPVDKDTLVGLKDLCGYSKDFNLDRFRAWASSFEMTRPVVWQYLNEQQQRFYHIQAVKLFLNDQSEIVFDPQMFSWGQPNNKVFQVPVEKALTTVSRGLISNKQTINIGMIPDEQLLSLDFLKLIKAFENDSNFAIDRISLIDREKNEIAGFSSVVKIKREYSIGMGAKHKEFAQWTQGHKASEVKPLYHAPSDRVLYFVRIKMDSLNHECLNETITASLNLLTLSLEPNSEPVFAIFTNKKDQNSENIISEFLTDWPNLGDSSNILPDNPSESEQVSMDGTHEITDIWAMFNHFAQQLRQYGWQRYFVGAWTEQDSAVTLADICRMKGTFWETSEYKVLSLYPENFFDKQGLNRSIARFNQSKAFDEKDRPVFIHAVF